MSDKTCTACKKPVVAWRDQCNCDKSDDGADREQASADTPQMTAPDGPARQGYAGRFDSLNSALEEAPATWVPALLETLVRRGVEQKVFHSEPEVYAGIVDFVKGVVKRVGS